MKFSCSLALPDTSGSAWIAWGLVLHNEAGGVFVDASGSHCVYFLSWCCSSYFTAFEEGLVACSSCRETSVPYEESWADWSSTSLTEALDAHGMKAGWWQDPLTATVHASMLSDFIRQAWWEFEAVREDKRPTSPFRDSAITAFRALPLDTYGIVRGGIVKSSNLKPVELVG